MTKNAFNSNYQQIPKRYRHKRKFHPDKLQHNAQLSQASEYFMIHDFYLLCSAVQFHMLLDLGQFWSHPQKSHGGCLQFPAMQPALIALQHTSLQNHNFNFYTYIIFLINIKWIPFSLLSIIPSTTLLSTSKCFTKYTQTLRVMPIG